MKYITNYKDFNKAFRKLDLTGPIMCDTETKHVPGITRSGLYGDIRLVQLYSKGWTDALVIDCNEIGLLDVLERLENCHLVGQNFIYDLHSISRQLHRPWVPKKVDDTRLMAKIGWYDLQGFDFSSLARRAGVEIDHKAESDQDWKKCVLTEEQLYYAEQDVVKLLPIYEALLETGATQNYAYMLDIFALYNAVDYSTVGLPINKKSMAEHKIEVEKYIEETQPKLGINPKSPKQCKELLGTTDSSMETLFDVGHGLKGDGSEETKRNAWLIFDLRQAYKKLSFIETYSKEDRIRGFFNPTNSVSGRWNCKAEGVRGYANLQQVPKNLRPHVIGYPENSPLRIVYSDFQALELRLAVAFTGEPLMTKYYLEGKDLHYESAKAIFKKDDISKHERTIGKVFNFTLIYGGSAWTVQAMLSSMMGGQVMPIGQVRKWIREWFNTFEGFKKWHNSYKEVFEAQGYIDTYTALGRPMRLYKYTDALNAPVQGTGAECTKMAIKLLYERYPDVKLIDTTHDDILLEAHEADAQVWVDRLTEAMTDGFDLVVKAGNYPSAHISMPREGEFNRIWEFS